MTDSQGDEAKAQLEQLNMADAAIMETINRLRPLKSSRELALTLTKLDEARLWLTEVLRGR
jgi:hypothetical protein